MRDTLSPIWRQDNVDSTHQALGAGIDDADEQEADGEPRLGILGGKFPERDDSEELHKCHARHANRRLYTQQEEIHVK